MSADLGNIDLGEQVGKNLKISANVSQHFIIITVDKARLCLLDQERVLRKSSEWVGFLGIFLAVLAALVAADFKDFYLKAAVWQALFIIIALLSFFMFVRAVIVRIVIWKKGGIDYVISQLKAESEAAGESGGKAARAPKFKYSFSQE